MIGLCISLVLAVGVFSQFERIVDWWRLRNYTPPPRIAAVADKAAFTPYARRLFYVNHPTVISGTRFTEFCTIAAEKTIVLGCYHTGDRGIFLHEITDKRLDGVVETTASHEMLHAAYARLSSTERRRIDNIIQQYYDSRLADERVRRTIDAYRATEPNELPNEMHSIFATEVRNLPAELETYYARYFTDRIQVVGLTEAYQAEFTLRRNTAADYDKQLTVLKQSIDNNQALLQTEHNTLSTEAKRLDTVRANVEAAEYNRQIISYNAQVRDYNALLETTKSQIEQYNSIVEKRNALALETQNLVKALNGDGL